MWLQILILPVIRPQAAYPIALSFIVFLCKMGMMIAPSSEGTEFLIHTNISKFILIHDSSNNIPCMPTMCQRFA